ncbi:MAG: tetratricopeptide repeat protein [Beijerinckiaceae bacterium]
MASKKEQILFERFQRASVLADNGRVAEAESVCRKILKSDPRHADTLCLVAMIAAHRNDFEAAALNFAKAARANPKHLDAHFNAGVALSGLGHHEEAIPFYRKALELRDDHLGARLNLATSFHHLGRYDDALEHFDILLAQRPGYPDGLLNCGESLRELGRFDEALEKFDAVLKVTPEDLGALNNRGVALTGLKRYEEATETFLKLLALNPGMPETSHALGNVAAQRNDPDTAVKYFEQAASLQPDFADARFAACFAELPILYETEGEIIKRRGNYEAKLKALAAALHEGSVQGDILRAAGMAMPFFLPYQGQNDAPLQRIYGEALCAAIARQAPAAPVPPKPAAGEKIRVGIVSPFFWEHTVWKLFLNGWLGQLDPSRFELYAYHVGDVHDAVTEIAAGNCKRFVAGSRDAMGWRTEILADAPHVLIWPGLFMDGMSTRLAAMRLAPVQCNAWGHPVTSGMPTMDYFLTSDLMEPKDGNVHYTEELVRLPGLGVWYEAQGNAPAPAAREDYGLPQDAPLFWCGHPLQQHLPQYDALYANIAKQAKSARFVFRHHDGADDVTQAFEQRMRATFEAAGLNAADHIVMLPVLDAERTRAVLSACDIFLDTPGWSNGAAALECLAANLPVVTLPGATMRSRQACAILEAIGVADTIAEDEQRYAAIAARLATKPKDREALKAKLAANRDKACRDAGAIKALEEFLEKAAHSYKVEAAAG